MLTLILPYPPSVNHYWGVCGKRRFVGKKGLAFRAEVFYKCAGLTTLITNDVRMLIEVYPPDKRKRDLDNTLKALNDSLEYAGILANDNQIADLRIIRREVSKPGKLIITIEIMDNVS